MLDQYAAVLDDAAKDAQSVTQLTEQAPISLADAYDIQKRSIACRYHRGERRTGFKLGFTSKAKQEQMGVSDLIWGRLTDAMIIDDGGAIDLAHYVHPRVEPEIAFVIGKPLSGEITAEQALDAIEAVMPALEVIDSRYRNFKFSHIDVVADNCSSTGYVLGPRREKTRDLSDLKMVMTVDGVPVAEGSSSAILDHPLNSVIEAARCLAEYGETLQPGDILLAGAATAAVALAPGQSVAVEVAGLGGCGFTVKED
ncbi:fumarylacetoacetate hydrolase family protein [Ferrimonas balearica]|nr:fumarylacetoacetate hydrolase family protein [Ferrimonas balearica]